MRKLLILLLLIPLLSIGQGVQNTVRLTDNTSTITFHYPDSTKHTYYKPQIVRMQTFSYNPYLVYVHTNDNSRTERIDTREFTPTVADAEELVELINSYLLLYQVNVGITSNLRFSTIRLDGDDSTQTALPYLAPTSEDSLVVGLTGREYTVLPGFRYFSVVFLPDAVEDCSLTINGLDYSANQGIYGRSLPERGDYKTTIDELYYIVAGAGCKVEITETR